ncbi:NADP(H)-dependent aldo-keto reductase [Acidihalobacter prosperus]|uniref:Protein tas n=1 Tax=Acidihalobacter prosperus TaxID=160660 RepID=A0A1A6C481_9GAMM|nr:NADP(H)-dependent aldo-keto reductase [Acidihalobacter prosperus]OBS09371.1 aldo/keto reductase [Acidihalobacter prosperus]
MQHRPLGHTDLSVSLICLGTMTFGEQNTEAEAHAQLDRALAAGINFVDAAEMYPVPPRAETQGRTESYIGSWLKKTGRRDDIVLASKVAGPGNGLGYLRGGPRLTATHIAQAVEDSLRRLNTDVIDLYQVHWPDRNTNFFGQLGYTHDPDEDATPIEETLTALARLVEQGKIRHIGLSNETPWGAMRYLHLAETLGLPRPASIQNPYSLLNRSFEAGLAEVAHREGLGLLAYSPLAFGVLSGKYLGGKRPAGARITLFERFQRYNAPYVDGIVAQYATLAAEHGLSLTQMALAYVNSRGFVTSNIIGATTLEQLDEDIGSAEINLDDTVLAAIERIHEQHPYPCP